MLVNIFLLNFLLSLFYLCLFFLLLYLPLPVILKRDWIPILIGTYGLVVGKMFVKIYKLNKKNYLCVAKGFTDIPVTCVKAHRLSQAFVDHTYACPTRTEPIGYTPFVNTYCLFCISLFLWKTKVSHKNHALTKPLPHNSRLTPGRYFQKYFGPLFTRVLDLNDLSKFIALSFLTYFIQIWPQIYIKQKIFT